MRTKTTKWIETTVRYERQIEDSIQKMVTKTYVVDAFTFGEAEEAITKEMTAFVSGEFNVKNITPANYGEIFFSDNANDDKWYKAKLTFITRDEKKGKDKRSNTNYLVQAGSFNAAVKNVEQVMGTTMVDYVIANIAETKIMDVYEHQAKTKNEEVNDKPEYEAAEDAKNEEK